MITHTERCALKLLGRLYPNGFFCLRPDGTYLYGAKIRRR